MSVSSNNAQLEAILATVNALPEAGGSSAPETCTVTISKPQQGKPNPIKLYLYSRFVNGRRLDCCFSVSTYYGITIIDESTLGSVTINDVIVGSIMELGVYGSDICTGTIDANCMVASNSTSVPTDVVDPNSITEENWEAGPKTLSDLYIGGISSSKRIGRFKILGDTTITMYDDD